MKKTNPKKIWLQTCFFKHTTVFSFFQDYKFPIYSRIARIFRTVEFPGMVPCNASAYRWTSLCFAVYLFLCSSSIKPSGPVTAHVPSSFSLRYLTRSITFSRPYLRIKHLSLHIRSDPVSLYPIGLELIRSKKHCSHALPCSPTKPTTYRILIWKFSFS